MNINQRIKMLRKEMGLNQKDFGAKIGLGQGAVSWIEKDGNTVIDVSSFAPGVYLLRIGKTTVKFQKK